MINPASIKYIAISIVVVSVITGSYLKGQHDSNQEWQIKWNDQELATANAMIKAEQDARIKTQELQRKIDEVAADAKFLEEKIQLDANVTNASVNSLREQARIYAAKANKCSSASTGGDPAKSSSMVLAELLDRSVERNKELAEAFDRSRAAGLACQAAYGEVMALTTRSSAEKDRRLIK
jgi:hypothetical protein